MINWIKNHKSMAILIVLILIFAIVVSSKKFWFGVFLIGLLAIPLAVLVALFKPSTFNRWFHTKVTRGQALKYLGVLFIVLFFAAAVTAPPKDIASRDASKSKQSAGTVKHVPAPAAEPKPTKQQAKFEAKVFSINVVDPATVMIPVQVTNTGKVAGKASCTVSASSANGTYHGFDVFDLPEEIKAGDMDYFNAKLTITKEGAAYVTTATATCD